MRIICYLALLCCFSGVRAQQHPVLLPAPLQVEYGKGRLLLHDLSLYMPAGAAQDRAFAINELRRIIKERTGVEVKITVRAVGQWGGAGGSQEAYGIDIGAGGVRIKALSSTGVYYSVQTIGQLIEGVGSAAFLPFVHIVDSPALAYRGVMMDFAHGSLLTVDEIKRQIAFLARWKVNQYYFYNEVSIALEGYPTLNYQASYTKAQIKNIIAYARERHMDVIPFVAFYGHLHELIRNEKYASLAIGKYGHELDPRNPAVNELLKNWIRQYAGIFDSPFIHVGFDETWETNRIATDVDTTIHSEDLWLRQLNFVQGELGKYGKKVMAWTDMNSFYPDIMAKFPREVTPVIWEYAPDSGALHHYLDPVLKEKRAFFIQPAVSGWGHIYPAAGYTYDNIDLCLKAGMINHTAGFITSVWTDAVEPFIRPSWSFMAYGCIGAWQGHASERSGFEAAYTKLVYPAVAGEMQQAFTSLAGAIDDLSKCLGRNTSNMPGGTLVESWLNPFSPYYLEMTDEHSVDLKKVRMESEEAEGVLIEALQHCAGRDSALINSLLVSARLINYSATRFIWAKTICDRWNESMLEKKKNDFVFYDISYTCHGLLVDMMNEIGEMKAVYAGSWLTESMPYRLNTMLGRFDVEFGLWQKLALKMQAYRIAHDKDAVATQTFEETFKPDF